MRATCYQLFIEQWLPHIGQKEADWVSEQLVYARKAGIVPWEWILDETRAAERPGTFKSPEEMLELVVHGYQRDPWQDQPCRIEVWSEKGTVRGTLGDMLRTYGVTFRVCHGNTSWTQSHDMANEYRADPRPTTILYVGDCDPKGMSMSDIDLPGRFAWEEVPVVIRRLTLWPDDARRLALPSFPASDKAADACLPWFLREYGETCWELDAMNPNELAGDRPRGHRGVP